MLNDPAALLQLGLGAALMLTTTTVAGRVGAWRASRRAQQASAAAEAFVPAPPPLPEPPRLSRPPLVDNFERHRLHSRRVVAPVKAAELLITFMQDQGATGYFTVAEIDEFWAWLTQEQNLDQLHAHVVRAELAGVPGVWLGLRRLNGPEYREVKARTGKDRAVIYRIPSPKRDALAAGRSAPGDAAGKARPGRTPTGNGPATVRPDGHEVAVQPAGATVRPSAEPRRHRTIADVSTQAQRRAA